MNDLAPGDQRLVRGRLAGRIACGLCLIALPALGWVVWQEAQTAQLVAAMEGPADRRAEALESFADTDPATLGDRANAALAQSALAAWDERDDPGLRQLYLARAGASIRYLRRKRPDWAPQLLLSARYEVTRQGGATPQALRDYAASYRAAPFLFAAARWRIAFGAEHWAQIDPATRAAMLEEALWFTHYDGRTKSDIMGLLGDTPAGMAFALRL